MNIFSVDNLLHSLGGAFLACLIWTNTIVGALFVLAIFGWMREGASHRRDGAWIGWITPHRMTEAMSWVVGGALFYLIDRSIN